MEIQLNTVRLAVSHRMELASPEVTGLASTEAAANATTRLVQDLHSENAVATVDTAVKVTIIAALNVMTCLALVTMNRMP